MQQFALRLQEKKTIADSVLELVFEKLESFDFKAGQFVQFLIPGSEKATPRSYSLATAPADKTLKFCIKLLENGVASTFFSSMNVDDVVEVKGPLGRFVARDGFSKLNFVATGAGLAPIMGIIRDELEYKKTSVPINLVFGLRHEKDIFWTDRLDALTKKHSNFSYLLCVSRPSETWTGAAGRVVNFLREIDATADYYMCGSAAMVMDVRTLLNQNGLKSEQIHFEIF